MLRPYNPELKSPHLTDDEDVYQVEMEPIPEPANTVLHGVGWLEAEMLARAACPLARASSVWRPSRCKPGLTMECRVRLRRVLHRALHLVADPRHARRQTRGRALRAAYR